MTTPSPAEFAWVTVIRPRSLNSQGRPKTQPIRIGHPGPARDRSLISRWRFPTREIYADPLASPARTSTQDFTCRQMKRSTPFQKRPNVSSIERQIRARCINNLGIPKRRPFTTYLPDCIAAHALCRDRQNHRRRQLRVPGASDACGFLHRCRLAACGELLVRHGRYRQYCVCYQMARTHWAL